MTPLKYSKTWPSILTKMAVVQLRVDSRGRTYSSIVEPACLTGPTNLVESNPNFCVMGAGYPQILVQTPGGGNGTCELPPPLPDVANVGDNSVVQVVGHHCQCGGRGGGGGGGGGAGSAGGSSDGGASVDRFRRHRFRSESIKIDNWDYIYTEKMPLKAVGSGVGSAPPDHLHHPACGDHRCISGQAALKASTLRRHYYPEGDWGWVIVLVGMLNMILNHGVQISGPLYLLPAGERFRQSAVNSAGECGKGK